MDANPVIPRRKRGLIFLAVSALMLVLGETVLNHSLSKVQFLVYWSACFICTGLAIVFAFLDVIWVQRQARQQQRELLEKTITDIARQKQARDRRSQSKSL